ncbi:polysaccharide deacetylase [Rhizobiales bacterium RZME27]|uniref:Polysaccharide deacetylase n=1 Tax=Endobacterium cereale TaxID=2663029 RepID=A0A6A8A8D6_9HYPH|nr:polysaccharide deacetylase family protein [Endobacterium cereale]MEB2845138.1 polysaccharide deacetylase family protein [Endobacterium cereale]MQY45910.1 polysaccharide deacetylase [Endobacterium cereale]
MTERLLIETLDRLASNGEYVDLWLRDDDCIEPTEALDAFLGAAARQKMPVTLAVIPAHTGEALAKRLESEPDVLVTVHGWSHENHAPAAEKKRELGLDRPIEVIEGQLREGLEKLTRLHEKRLFPMLVPPWNRIDPAVIERLPGLGFNSLSTFGPEKPAAVPMLNTHVDVIDWHGTRGGRDPDLLFAETAALCRPGGAIGMLTHHLVHDDVVADFLDRLFGLTASHSGCRWRSAADILASPAFPADQEA